MAKFENCSRKRFWYSFTDLSVGLLLERFFLPPKTFSCLVLSMGSEKKLYNYTTDKFAGSNMSGLLT